MLRFDCSVVFFFPFRFSSWDILLFSFPSHYDDVVEQSPSKYCYWEDSKPENLSLIVVMFGM